MSQLSDKEKIQLSVVEITEFLGGLDADSAALAFPVIEHIDDILNNLELMTVLILKEAGSSSRWLGVMNDLRNVLKGKVYNEDGLVEMSPEERIYWASILLNAFFLNQ